MKKKKKPKSKAATSVKSIVQTEPMDHVQKDEFIDGYPEQKSQRIPNISIGDKVIMTNKYIVPNDIIGIIWTVISEPKYEDGARRVHLKGYKGGYPVDGLRVVG